MKWLFALLMVSSAVALSCYDIPGDFFSNVQIVVGSKARISDGILASQLASAIARKNIKVVRHELEIQPELILNIEGNEYRIYNNTTILPYGVSVSGLFCNCNYHYYYEIVEPDLTDLVMLDDRIPYREHRIFIGGWYVNKYSSWTRSKLRIPGDMMCYYDGRDVWVAGYTADDTIRASYPLRVVLGVV